MLPSNSEASLEVGGFMCIVNLPGFAMDHSHSVERPAREACNSNSNHSSPEPSCTGSFRVSAPKKHEMLCGGQATRIGEWGLRKDAAFVLKVGGFLLMMEFFCLLTVDHFSCLTYNWSFFTQSKCSFFTCRWNFFAYSGRKCVQ